MNMFRLQCDIAVNAIRMYNADPVLVASDRMLTRHFNRPLAEHTADSLTEAVVLLDALWQTQMFRDDGGTVRVARCVISAWETFTTLLPGLQPNALKNECATVSAAATTLAPIILNARGVNDEEGKQHYSFTTKFLHWMSPAHFPIADSRARAAINAFQRTHGVTRGHVPTMPDSAGYLMDYERWIRFYSELLRSMPEETEAQLLATDAECGHPFGRSRSIIRVLDKAFYMAQQSGGINLVAST